MIANVNLTPEPLTDSDRLEGLAEALWAADWLHRTGFDAPSGAWPDIENPDYYRLLARAALKALSLDQA